MLCFAPLLLLCVNLEAAQSTKSAAKHDTQAQDSKDPANPYNIDYPNLDPKYYPYIQSRNAYYDRDIIHIIHKVDKAERKNAFFIGGAYGMNGNVSLPLFSMAKLVGTSAPKSAGINAGLFGFRAGYQKYTGKMLPIDSFGYQVYIDFCVSFGRNGLFFTALNVDMLWDFLELEQIRMSLNAGVGVGGAKIAGLAIPPYSDRYEAAYRLNLGMSAHFQDTPHKLGLYFGSTQGLMRGFLGYTLMIGYDYVF